MELTINDIKNIRKDFPILDVPVYEKPYIYFDNAATTYRPVQVAESEKQIYLEFNGNPHRGNHYMSNKTTDAFEEVRDKVKQFINAAEREEIIFTRGTTESINLVAYSFGEAFVHEGDEVIVTEMEHHANLVPWQLICERKKAKLRFIPFDDSGRLQIEKLPEMINANTKILAVTMVSNVMGVVNPINEIIKIAHEHKIPVLLDAAQSIQHTKIDVQELDCDFLVFSGHKMYGPTGVGGLYGKRKWLEAIPPFLCGGEMINKVTFEKTTFNVLPYKFEAGTPNFEQVIGMGAAIDYINNIGLDRIAKYESELLAYAHEKLSEITNIRFFGNTNHQSSVISFLVGKIHPYDLGMFLDKMGIAVRTGHHCADPIMDHFNIPGTVRISFAVYNTKAEIDQFVVALKKIIPILGE